MPGAFPFLRWAESQRHSNQRTPGSAGAFSYRVVRAVSEEREGAGPLAPGDRGERGQHLKISPDHRGAVRREFKRSTVSDLAKRLDVQVEAWSERPQERGCFPS